MTQIIRSALVARPAQVLFDLVNDIEAYPKMFSWCSEGRVETQSESVLRCFLGLHYRGIRTSFTTLNTLSRPNRIDLNLIDGPFSALHGHWDFSPIGDAGCRISLQLDFDFAGKWIGSALALGFQALADKMVDDFVRVARSLPLDLGELELNKQIHADTE